MKSLQKFLHSLKKSSQGFTLIELLVVIGILGVLAAALVATIDPFEQLKKANDANVKNTAVEFIDANIRYYTTHNDMPWSPAGCLGANAAGTIQGTLYPAFTACLASLVNDGEIKAAFTTVTGVLSSIVVSGDANNITACFQPQSKAQRNDPNTKWDQYGSVSLAGCPNATATTCYWCSE
ncbi:MAG TPA: type II secretion system protein [Candidatus Saccharimonadales bacterium]|nr:type II secretion system protein [Candidatus Saccharimonadales bacterium]